MLAGLLSHGLVALGGVDTPEPDPEGLSFHPGLEGVAVDDAGDGRGEGLVFLGVELGGGAAFLTAGAGVRTQSAAGGGRVYGLAVLLSADEGCGDGPVRFLGYEVDELP